MHWQDGWERSEEALFLKARRRSLRSTSMMAGFAGTGPSPGRRTTAPLLSSKCSLFLYGEVSASLRRWQRFPDDGHYSVNEVRHRRSRSKTRCMAR